MVLILLDRTWKYSPLLLDSLSSETLQQIVRQINCLHRPNLALEYDKFHYLHQSKGIQPFPNHSFPELTLLNNL